MPLRLTCCSRRQASGRLAHNPIQPLSITLFEGCGASLDKMETSKIFDIAEEAPSQTKSSCCIYLIISLRRYSLPSARMTTVLLVLSCLLSWT